MLMGWGLRPGRVGCVYTYVMSATAENFVVAAREMPCPMCGYDLRGTERGAAGVRCPECGKVIRAAGYSRVPWVWRRYRGWVRSYLATLWLAVVRPGRMAGEMNIPASMGEARKFQWVSVVVMVVLGTALMELGILAREDPLAVGREVAARLVFWDTRDLLDSDAFGAAGVTTDRWFEIFPLAVGMYAAVRVNLALYRWLWTRGLRKRYERRRAACAATYFSGLWVVLMVLLGLVWSANWWAELAYRAGGPRHVFSDWRVEMPMFQIGIGAGALLLFVYGTINYGVRLRPRWRVVAVLAFPAVALLVGGTIMFWVHAVAGYVLLAVRSMTV
jgi:hypothetical protein